MKERRTVGLAFTALALAAAIGSTVGLAGSLHPSGGRATTVQANTSWGWPACPPPGWTGPSPCKHTPSPTVPRTS
ncbi:hypothetical protein [Kitasatospora viridis]|uniref:Uncharacterized protein n=1 Tax=Kitasatospora viridis TaxID=281105 RepID=A0A561SFD2_9ACTN|nr:hypothetical protein [Kitasatospora viridis]TWF73576.1 hypothetical protein FHX73_15189 [Kitasatospora viridis]